MAHLVWLSEEAWAAMQPHVDPGKLGKARVDDRRVISGILHVLKTGCRWRDCSSEYGPTTGVSPDSPSFLYEFVPLRVSRQMRTSRFYDDQMVRMLKEHEGGVSKAAIYRTHGLSPASF